MIKFTEEKLELAILELLGKEGFPHVHGGTLERATGDVLLREDLRAYLSRRYAGWTVSGDPIGLAVNIKRNSGRYEGRMKNLFAETSCLQLMTNS